MWSQGRSGWSCSVSVGVTRGWTGADLAGLIRSAASYLTQRLFTQLDALSPPQQEQRLSLLDQGDQQALAFLQWGDLLNALREVKPGDRVPLRQRLLNTLGRWALHKRRLSWVSGLVLAIRDVLVFFVLYVRTESLRVLFNWICVERSRKPHVHCSYLQRMRQKTIN